eukprot:3311589-Amphidinium_carterae.2
MKPTSLVEALFDFDSRSQDKGLWDKSSKVTSVPLCLCSSNMRKAMVSIEIPQKCLEHVFSSVLMGLFWESVRLERARCTIPAIVCRSFGELRSTQG